MKLRIFGIILTFFIGQVCYSQNNFGPKIDELRGNPLMKGAGIGILVYDQEKDSVLYELNSTISFVPASVLKLVTSATALEILGGDYTFTTSLAKVGIINHETNELDGNLVIIGGGDPTLGSEYFSKYNLKHHFLERWCRAINSEGISGINGDICVDASIYDDHSIPDTWIWGDIGNYYGAGASGISVYDNLFRITLSSDEKPDEPVQIIGVDSNYLALVFENQVLSSNVNGDNVTVYSAPWGNQIKMAGTIPKGKDNFIIKASLHEPGIVLANDLKSKLQEAKIDVTGGVKKSKTPSDIVPFYEFNSPPLSEIIKVMNHESVNLIAEHLIKQIAYYKTGTGSTKEGVKIIKNFWHEKGIETNGMFLEDGSGLSRFNAISPKQVVDILKYMKDKSTNSDIFINSLPSAGEGTLYVFDPDNFPSRSLICKSGSMTRVRCYAGYLKTDSGKQFIFAFMANNFSMNQSEMIDKIEELLVEIRRTN